MNILISALNTFIGAGATSALVGYLAGHIDQIIAAIIWTYPFTLIIPLFILHKNKKSNKFLSNYVYKQSYAVILLVAFLAPLGYFLSKTPNTDGVLIPLMKSSGIWLICSVIFYFVVKYANLDKHFK